MYSSLTTNRKPQTDRLTTLRQQLDNPTPPQAQMSAQQPQQPQAQSSGSHGQNFSQPVQAQAPVKAQTIQQQVAGAQGSPSVMGQQPTSGFQGGLSGQTILGPSSVGTAVDDQQPYDAQSDQDKFIAMLMNDVNNVDTSEEEALIQEQMDRLMGQNLMDSAARAGASGMAMSGAQLAAEGGIRSDAARDVSAAQLGVRSDARQSAIDNALSAIDASIGLENLDQNSELFDVIMDMLGEDPEGPQSDGQSAVSEYLLNKDDDGDGIANRDDPDYNPDAFQHQGDPGGAIEGSALETAGDVVQGGLDASVVAQEFASNPAGAITKYGYDILRQMGLI